MIYAKFIFLSFLILPGVKLSDSSINSSESSTEKQKIFSEGSCMRGESQADENCNLNQEKSHLKLFRWDPVKVKIL